MKSESIGFKILLRMVFSLSPRVCVDSHFTYNISVTERLSSLLVLV